MIGKIKILKSNEIIDVYSSDKCPGKLYGSDCWLDDKGTLYGICLNYLYDGYELISWTHGSKGIPTDEYELLFEKNKFNADSIDALVLKLLSSVEDLQGLKVLQESGEIAVNFDRIKDGVVRFTTKDSAIADRYKFSRVFEFSDDDIPF